MKVSVTVNKCNYCGSKVLLIDDFGECPKHCPGNMDELFEQSCDIPQSLINKILKEFKQDTGNTANNNNKGE